MLKGLACEMEVLASYQLAFVFVSASLMGLTGTASVTEETYHGGGSSGQGRASMGQWSCGGKGSLKMEVGVLAQ